MNHPKKKNKKYQIASFGVDDVKLYDLSNILFSNISFLLIAIKNKSTLSFTIKIQKNPEGNKHIL